MFRDTIDDVCYFVFCPKCLSMEKQSNVEKLAIYLIFVGIIAVAFLVSLISRP